MWVLATRGRPARCQEFLESIIHVGCESPGIVITDGDDDARYLALPLPHGWRLVRQTEHCGLLATLNCIFASFPNEPWYGCLNDDAIVHTHGWDVALIKAAGNAGFASCDDGWQRNKGMNGAVVFGGDLLRAWGWWCPRGLWHCYADNFFHLAAAALHNWTYVPDVLVEHRHHYNGKAEMDQTYRDGVAKLVDDERVFQKFCERDLAAAIARSQLVLSAK